MPDIFEQLDALDVLKEAELIVLASQYPVFDVTAQPSHLLRDPLFKDYMQCRHDIEVRYARTVYDLKKSHNDMLIRQDLQQHEQQQRKPRDWVVLPRFTLWDIVLGLLGR